MVNKFCSCDNFFNNKNESISLAYQSNKDILEKPNSSFRKSMIPVTNEQKKIDSNKTNDIIKENLDHDMKKNSSEKTNIGFNTNETVQKNFQNHNIEKMIDNKEDEDYNNKYIDLENEKKLNYENGNVNKYNLNSPELNNNLIHENIIEENLEKENNNGLNKNKIENYNNKITFDDLIEVINSNNKNENNDYNNINNNDYQSNQYKNENESQNNEYDSEKLYQNQKENNIFSLCDED